ncbi:hypothetical protein KJ632_03565 [Patescibacteria group bacterium]|nr:hypothetical protein [Patescibacteria group bacterium]
MTLKTCAYFKETEEAGPGKSMRFEPMANVGGEQLPVFGEQRQFESRRPDDVATFHICGICNALNERVAVELHRYENLCMQAEHHDCGRFKRRVNNALW